MRNPAARKMARVGRRVLTPRLMRRDENPVLAGYEISQAAAPDLVDRSRDGREDDSIGDAGAGPVVRPEPPRPSHMPAGTRWPPT